MHRSDIVDEHDFSLGSLGRRALIIHAHQFHDAPCWVSLFELNKGNLGDRNSFVNLLFGSHCSYI